jgi:hypothetical protein
LYKKDNTITPSIISKLVDFLKPLDMVVHPVPFTTTATATISFGKCEA